MNDLEGIVHEDLKRHVVSTMFTNTNPLSTVLFTFQREWCIIHVIVDRFIEMVVEKRTDVIGDASGSTERGGPKFVRVNIVKQEANVKQA